MRTHSGQCHLISTRLRLLASRTFHQVLVHRRTRARAHPPTRARVHPRAHAPPRPLRCCPPTPSAEPAARLRSPHVAGRTASTCGSAVVTCTVFVSFSVSPISPHAIHPQDHCCDSGGRHRSGSRSSVPQGRELSATQPLTAVPGTLAHCCPVRRPAPSPQDRSQPADHGSDDVQRANSGHRRHPSLQVS